MNRNFFLILLEAKKYMIKIPIPTDSVSGEEPLPVSQMAIFFLCPHKAEEDKVALWAVLYKSSYHLPKAPPSK